MPDDNQSDTYNLTRRKILAGAGAIGLAGASAGLGTSAYFSDQETFTNNQLVAGELDMKVSWEEHYSDWSEDEAEYADMEDGELVIDDQQEFMNATLQEQFPDKHVKSSLDEGELEACEELADVPDDLEKPVIELTDVKPGDFGEITFDFALCDNPGFVWMTGELLENAENDLTEPEAEDSDEDDAPGDETTTGELADALEVTIWHDDCDNLKADSEEEIFSGSLRDGLARLADEAGLPIDSPSVETFSSSDADRGCFAPEKRHCIGFRWELPVDRGNELQTDSVRFDLGFYTEQCRHNTGEGIEDEFPRDVVDTLLDKKAVSIDSGPTGAQVTFGGPVQPGLKFIEQNPEGDQTELEVPTDQGEYYAFIIDEQPGYGFAHQVQYAWLEPNREECGTASASWFPYLSRNGGDGPRVVLDGSISREIGGISWNWEGSPRLVIDDVIPGMVNATQRIPAPITGINNNGEQVKWPDCFGLVIDGGDDPHNGASYAEAIANDTNGIEDWLRSQNFIVQRISQYHGNMEPKLGTADPTNIWNELLNILGEYRKAFTKCCNQQPEQENFEICFFVYIHAHGFRNEDADPTRIGFVLYDPRNNNDNDTPPAVSVTWDMLFGELNRFPDCVRMGIFLDACYSGEATNHVNLQNNGEEKEEFILTSCRGNEISPFVNETRNQDIPTSATDHFNGGGSDLSDRVQSVCDGAEAHNDAVTNGNDDNNNNNDDNELGPYHPQIQPDNKDELGLPECLIPSEGGEDRGEQEFGTN